MDIHKLKRLIELLKKSDITELELHEGEESIRISRHETTAQPPVGTTAQPPIMSAPPQPQAFGTMPLGVPTPEPVAATADDGPEENLVRSPMVGTLYRSPTPGSEPFVQEGAKIKAGDTLCIIEAMKILNQIESEKDGTITRILAENGQPVEYNQPLFVIE